MNCIDCGRKLKRWAQRCKACGILRQKQRNKQWYKDHAQAANAKAIAWYRSHPEVKKLWVHNNPEKAAAGSARAQLKKFLTLAGLSAKYDIRQLISDIEIPNDLLEKLTKGGGWPDWRNEGLEEKTVNDYLRATQWARAILEYRAGRKYKVAWRYTSTKRKVFQTVFDFYEWQQRRKD
jgi:hypothetical protein